MIAVLARCFPTGSAFGLDDLFVIAALLFALPMGILEFVMSADGFGKDIWNIPAEKIYQILKVRIFLQRRVSTLLTEMQLSWLTEVFYFAAITFTKISFCFFCLRIFPRQELRITLFILIGICTAYGIIFTIMCLFNCLPVSYIWESWDGEHTGKCINFHIFA